MSQTIPHQWIEARVQAMLATMLRTDFASFLSLAFQTVSPGDAYAHNWHIDAIIEHLEAVQRGDIHRLIINLPPRHLKSIIISVAWPAFLLGHTPSMRIIAASYAHGLALKLSQDTRLLMQSAWYRALFPATTLRASENTQHKFVTTARGFRLATSVGASLIGEGADVIVVDDPLNPARAFSQLARSTTNRWFEQSLATRLNSKRNGAIVVVMQRLHADDLCGHLTAKGNWHQLVLPALSEGKHTRWDTRPAGEPLQPAREDRETLAKLAQEIGSYAFAAQYQQNPVGHDNGLLRRSWLKHAPLPAPLVAALHARTIQPIQSWDTAIKSGATNDASVCLTAALWEGAHWLLDVWVGREEYPALRRRVLQLANAWHPSHVLMEDTASGQSLLQDLRRDSTLPLIGIRPRGSKIERAAMVSPMLESGQVWLPVDAPWREALEAELEQFPTATHDDQVDALTQYLQWQQRRTAMPRATMRRI